ncbi:tryptophan transporter [Clostridium sp. Ade.TY]|uniref:tryptophan transporter n=1 Tax=Clostridium sp. Ade.TY TaxID=1391647 RepID=UPI0003FBEE0B|nr:tryptophan transporter [Clostridium sp. Ade.TY]
MRNTEKTKRMIINALLLGIGVILHQITPALGLPMQPDFALIMLFIIMIINKDDYKTCLISGIITGIFTAMTTKFPGGQLPNMIDKLITVNLMFVVIMLINKLKIIKNMADSKRRTIESLILFPVGTLVSGLIFLLSASVLVGLPVGFSSLFIVVVLPSVAINLVAGFMLFKIIRSSMRSISLKEN